MADLSWAREAGTERRAALERAGKTHATEAQLVNAMFDGLITQLWRRLGSGLKETVDAYNSGGRFSDLSFVADNERIIVERRHHPAFAVQIALNRSARTVIMTIRDEPQDARSEQLEVVFVDEELLLWHAGQTENGYQLAKRVLKPRL
jgi:hypothetical protein